METRIISLVPTELETEFSIRDIFGIWAYHYSRTFVFRGESHAPWELVYIHSGKVIVETSTYSVPLSAGNIILHRPFEPHKIKADHVTCQVITFCFNVDKNEALYDIAGKVLTAGSLETAYIMTLFYNGIEIVAGKNYSTPSFSSSPKFASKQIVKNTLELLLLELKRSVLYPQITGQVFRNNSSNNITTNTIILTVINYLNDNICEKITLNDVAKKTEYSVSNISALFKKYTGESIMDYFIKMRIQKACELLMQNDLSVKAVSEQLNFSTAQYFSSQFKKLIGITPLQYKKEMKGKNHLSGINFEDV